MGNSSGTRQRPRTPVLTPPEKRGLFGGLYAAKLLFEFYVRAGGRAGVRRLCEERVVVLDAPSAAAALREAKRQGRAGEYRYRNSQGAAVHFRFVGLMDLLHLGVECEPNEVWYNIVERVRPMERRRGILPTEGDLHAIREERTARDARS